MLYIFGFIIILISLKFDYVWINSRPADRLMRLRISIIILAIVCNTFGSNYCSNNRSINEMISLLNSHVLQPPTVQQQQIFLITNKIGIVV